MPVEEEKTPPRAKNKQKQAITIITTAMKRFKEITLENLGELKSIINAVKREANEKKDYAGKCVILIGEETIRKAIDRYHINGSEYQWERADEAVQHLKINGSAKFVYTAQVLVYWDARWINRGTAEIEYITKNISYNGYLLSAYKDSYSDKTYNFHLFNEASDDKQGVTLDKPNKVGTLTDKKADAWLSVLLDEADKRQEAKKAADDRKAAFMERMSKLTKRPVSTFEHGGSLHLGMFLVKWDYYTDGRAYTRIEINPCSKDEKGEYMSSEEKLSILADCGLLG